MNDQYIENDCLELLDALEIGFDLTHCDIIDEECIDETLVIDQML
jgi:hypothetical protein